MTDFITTVKQAFCEVLDPLVDDEIEPDDVWEPLQRIVGEPLTREKLAGLSPRQRRDLTAAYEEWFECPIKLADIQEALELALGDPHTSAGG